MYKDTFCLRLKALRKERKLSLEVLANELERDRSTVNYWELGKNEPSINELGKIADYFNVSLDYLFGRSDS